MRCIYGFVFLFLFYFIIIILIIWAKGICATFFYLFIYYLFYEVEGGGAAKEVMDTRCKKVFMVALDVASENFVSPVCCCS